MDKKSKILFSVFLVLIIGVVGINYYKYFIAKDYYIQAEADCDPEVEACFTYVCDPEVDADCSGDKTERTSYYKIVRKKASLIPLCDPNDEKCDPLVCAPGEDCEETLCEENNKDGIECNDPEKYKEENAEELESDEECDSESGDCEEESLEEEDEEVSFSWEISFL